MRRLPIQHPAKNVLYRAVFKQTSKVVMRGKYTKAGHKAGTRAYITRYADEEGKKNYTARKEALLQKEFEKSDESKYPKTPDREIPIGQGGCFLGGFLLNQGISEEPKKGENFKKNWAGRIAERWEELIEHPMHHHNSKHHYNTVISLEKGQELEILKAGLDPYLCLKAVAKRTMDIYAQKRGWDPGSIGYMGGIHFDKDHIHVHLRLFPNNSKGKPLSLSNDPKNYRDPEKQHRISWIQASNQALEEWWRQEMPDNQQNPLVKLARKTNNPDPEIPGNPIYLSASRIEEYSQDEALHYLDAVVNAERILPSLPTLEKKKKPTPIPTIIRRAVALWAYFNPEKAQIPGIEELDGSDETKLKVQRATLFSKTWAEVGKGNKRTLLDILPWLEKRREKLEETTEGKKSRLREANALRKLAQREHATALREEVRAEPLPREQSDLLSITRRATQTPGLTIAEFLEKIEGPGTEEFKLEVSRLPESEFQQLEKSSNIGWTILLATAEKVDRGITKDNALNLTGQLRNWVSKCYQEVATALKAEVLEEYPKHLSLANISKIREMCQGDTIPIGKDLLPEYGVELAYGSPEFNLSYATTPNPEQTLRFEDILETASRIPAIKENFEKETPGLKSGPLLGPAIEKTKRLAGPELGFSRRKKQKKGPNI